MIQIEKIILHRINMPLRTPFKNSRKIVKEKDIFVIELVDQDGLRGFGESVAFHTPWYTEETTNTVYTIIKEDLAPIAKLQPFDHPNTFIQKCEGVRRNHMAKAAIEGAIWDLYAKREHVPLYRAIGGRTAQVSVGAAIGIKRDFPILKQSIQTVLAQGYQRIKLKINRENDLTLLEKVRNSFPDIKLMVDANSAYTLQDIEHLKSFDQFDLMMIEQPLAQDDFVDHAKLQEKIQTPICLDESIHTLSDAKTAIELNSCKIISIKLGRVGGFTNAITIHDLCVAHHIPVWCGGMLEAGVGRAQSLALATLPGFTLPADPGASNRYWHQDIITPEVEIENGQITLLDKPGIGYEIDHEALAKFRIEKIVL